MAVSDKMARAVMQAVNEQLGRQTFYDVTIVVGDRTFECHRFLLSACSQFFRAMFSSGMSEALNQRAEIKGIDPETFSLVIDCIYKARNVLNSSNVISIWHAANHLQIDFLIECCETFQAKKLSKDNCIEVYENAKLLDSKLLLKMSWKLMVKEFEHFRGTEDFLMLDSDDMVKLVADDKLIVRSEDMVIDAIMKWVNFTPEHDVLVMEEQPLITSDVTSAENVEEDEKQARQVSEEDSQSQDKDIKLKEEQSNDESMCKIRTYCEGNPSKKLATSRENCLPNLLEAARICLVSSTCIQALIENKIVVRNPKAFAIIVEGLRYQLQPGRKHDYCPPYAIHRSSSQLSNVTVAIYNEAGQVKMSCRSMDGTWFQLAAPGYMCKAVTYENDIYSVCSQLAYKYCSATNIWIQLPNTSFGRNNNGIVCIDDYIYAVGGDNITAIERLNAADEQGVQRSGKWVFIGHLKKAVSNTLVTTFGSNIVVFGSNVVMAGSTSENNISTIIQCFDTQTMAGSIYADEMTGSSKNMVAFKQGSSTYLLQETGALWKLVTCDKSNINLEFRGMIWKFSIELSAAVICNQELLVLAKSIDADAPRDWGTPSYSEFKHVRIFERDAYCFLNNVMLKTTLTVKEV